MIQASFSQIAKAIDGIILDGDMTFLGVSIDSRNITSDNLYVALKGDRVDGHDFLESAAIKGAAGAIISDSDRKLDIPCILVKDTKVALAKLAKFWLDFCQVKVVGITGSCGKTSTRSLVENILSKSKLKYIASRKNYNSETGLPLTLFDLSPDDEWAVLEMGARKAGDIDYLCEIAPPDISVVTNVHAAHLGVFLDSVKAKANNQITSINANYAAAGTGVNSDTDIDSDAADDIYKQGLDVIANTKGGIYRKLKTNIGLSSGFLNSKSVAVLNLDEKYLDLFKSFAGSARFCSFGIKDSTGHFFASDIKLNAMGSIFTLVTPSGKREVSFGLLGRHSIYNALAAASICHNMGIDLDTIAEGLAGAKAYSGRLEVQNFGNITIINDAYNASPAGTKAALDALSSFPGIKLFAFADMTELGEGSESAHEDIANYAKSAGVDFLFTYGNYAKITSDVFGGQHFSDKFAMANLIMEFIKNNIVDDNLEKQDIVILVKGANAMQATPVVHALEDFMLELGLVENLEKA